MTTIDRDAVEPSVENTDRELWRGPDEGAGNYYADSIFVTDSGGIGINCGGHVIVLSLREWHRLAQRDRARALIQPNS